MLKFLWWDPSHFATFASPSTNKPATSSLSFCKILALSLLFFLLFFFFTQHEAFSSNYPPIFLPQLFSCKGSQVIRYFCMTTRLITGLLQPVTAPCSPSPYVSYKLISSFGLQECCFVKTFRRASPSPPSPVFTVELVRSCHTHCVLFRRDCSG